MGNLTGNMINITSKLIFLTFSILSFFQCTNSDSPSSIEMLKKAESVSNKWRDAYLTHNVDSLEELLSSDYTYSGAPSSKISSRKEVIDYFKTMPGRYLAIDFEDINFRVYGKTVLMTGRETITVLENADTLEYRMRFSDVLVLDSLGVRHYGRVNKIDTSPLTPGLYFIEVESASGEVIRQRLMNQ